MTELFVSNGNEAKTGIGRLSSRDAVILQRGLSHINHSNLDTFKDEKVTEVSVTKQPSHHPAQTCDEESSDRATDEVRSLNSGRNQIIHCQPEDSQLSSVITKIEKSLVIGSTEPKGKMELSELLSYQQSPPHPEFFDDACPFQGSCPAEVEQEETYDLKVENVAPEATDDELWKIFKPFGITKAKICSKHHSLGYANVSLNSFKGALTAIQYINGHTFHGRTIRVCLDYNKYEGSKLCVEYDGDERELWKIFCPFGFVYRVLVVRHPQNNKGLAYRFVTLHAKANAMAALEKLNNTVINGKSMRLWLVELELQKPASEI